VFEKENIWTLETGRKRRMGRIINKVLHNLYSSPDIIIVIKSKRTRWEAHTARMGSIRNAYNILVGRPERKRPQKKTSA
jgi:hypothetical protein